MSALVARSLEHVHGHLGWLAAAALAHPALLLSRRPERRVSGAALTATVLVTVTAAVAVAIYPAYRAGVKPAIFAAAPAIGLLFERKEHLGVAALALAWCGLAMHTLAHRRGALRHDLGRAASVAYAGAALAATLAATGGLVVACFRPL
jgi:hypothetical protein